MSSYVKFMKNILAKLGEYEIVALIEECSVILQKKLPSKLKDPGRFNISCFIGNSIFEKALCDLGVRINLMPLSILKKLDLGEVGPTIVALQLAYRSLKHSRGVIENVLVKVDKFIFPTDFIVLVLIDVQKGELKLRVHHVFKETRHLDNDGYDEGSVMKIGTNDTILGETDKATTIFEPP